MNNGKCTTVIVFLFCNALSTTEGGMTKAPDDDIHCLLLFDDATTVAASSTSSSTSDVVSR